ncbi:hypothetical protein SLS59_007351 [Nothophoma quercina]|uniref:Uncharacterized protein n=1 Tax=Nothophoma quercina TaxID=749835 RepID=A0ABR3QZS4_9PLEO
MLLRPTPKYRFQSTAILLPSTKATVALPAEIPERKSPQNTMASDESKKNDTATGNAPGGRGGPASSLGNPTDTVGNALSTAGNTAGNATGNDTSPKDANSGFGLDGKDVKGSLKVHIKLDLEADIRIIAKIKGDIAIGLL